MDWLIQLNDALRYIEEQLNDEIELEQVSKLSNRINRARLK